MVNWEDRRLSFGAGAEEYDRRRPTYPADALRWLLGDAPRRVLDLGSGTGLLGRAVAALGHDVVAVEPDDGMRAVAARRLEALAGTAEAIPLPDASVAAVVAGQAWHWFDHARAVAEVRRVLRAPGVLGVLWNLRDGSVPWVAEFNEIVGDPQFLDEDQELAEPFEQLRIFRHEIGMDAAGLLELATTFSHVRLHPDRDAILDRVRRLAAGLGDLIVVPYGCVTLRAFS